MKRAMTCYGTVRRGPGGTDGAPRGTADRGMVSGARAAAELGLRRGEFQTAVQLGLVRAAARGPDGVPRWPRTELARVGALDGFPDALREQVRTIGTMPAAALLGTSPGRFTRLARCGHLTPAAYRINRYRVVVWSYLAAEVGEFARRRPELLRGPAPARDREGLAAGTDLRARGWRLRRTGQLLRACTDPWERAAVLAAPLPPHTVAEDVPDGRERILLAALAPARPYGHPVRPAAAEVAGRLLRVQQPDEAQWYRRGLLLALERARSAAPGTASVEDDGLQGADIDPRAVHPGELAVLVQ
ncbi:DUF6397 family protein [Streptomyces bambusae]|uniref:DUF6397 family protein n=1 Tax=Streptomyces bambusae TaxID=1550616 RepID=UPI001CFEAECA|nr:DUF6397 family protein [Streptomyces bambusae]MCB5168403.1 DUF6397 family protein [Streptomyces bambusae]